MSYVAKCIRSGLPHTVMGEVEEGRWTTIAVEVDGVPQPDEVGKVTLTRRVHFAFKQEMLDWFEEQEKEGWTRSSEKPVPCATAYFGPTDSDSNCWSGEVQKAGE